MFSLNLLSSVTKIFVITVKGIKPANFCVRDHDAPTVPVRSHVRDRISKFPFHLGKPPYGTIQIRNWITIEITLQKKPRKHFSAFFAST